MKFYRVSATGDFSPNQSRAIWVSAKREMPAAKREIQTAEELHTDPTVDEFDIPTDKRGLLAFLNKHCDTSI